MAQGPAQDRLVAVVDFNHARGPEIEFWLGAGDGVDPAADNGWGLLPFMALTDGAHTATEDFSYFTLLRKASDMAPATSLFGISCTRQIKASRLKNKSAAVTRSTVQKAVVVVTNEAQHFGQLRERLSMVTTAWFAQEDFSDIDILKKFQESLSKNIADDSHLHEEYFGLSLREMIHEFKYQTLVLFKCCLLQPKMLFFGSRCERLCMTQFSLVSLIPGLIRSLQDCADPALDSYAQTASKATSLRSSERSSMLAYMGLPLQVFGKGAFFGPYTPLQQLDLLSDYGTKSYIVGSTNSLLLQQKDKYSDILINLDDRTINITSPSLRSALSLSAADRRWIDFLTQTVVDTWDPANPSRPNTMGYAGSEEFIRLQFEEYLLALLSSIAWQTHHESVPLTHHPAGSNSSDRDINTDPTYDYNVEFVSAWRLTSNFKLFSRLTSENRIFDVAEPRHPTAGGLSVEDVQRRLAQQVSELHLDERVREGRETLNKTLVMGREKMGQVTNKLWADIEAMRESQRKRAAEGDGSRDRASTGSLGTFYGENEISTSPSTTSANIQGSSLYGWTNNMKNTKVQAPDLSYVQASAKQGAVKAGAYLSSWGSWAKDRGKEWQEKRNSGSDSTLSSNKPPITVPSSVGTHPADSSTTTSGRSSPVSQINVRSSAESVRRWGSNMLSIQKGKESGEVNQSIVQKHSQAPGEENNCLEAVERGSLDQHRRNY